MINKRIFWATVFFVWLGGSIISVFFTPALIMKAVEFRMHEEIGVNTLMHKSTLSTYVDRDVVRPNNDTLYSTAWLDLSEGPLVLKLPDMDERYYSFQFLNTDTSVSNVIGTRTTGQQAIDILLVGPESQACVSEFKHVVRLPENKAWLLGRTLVDGPTDLLNAVSTMEQYQLLSPATCG
ncbi:hypothetical protein R50073_34100 [Maricurvus nonylphenolicus]|uniref:DUF1254 domain-containing protein n=1 Tax=Maricurvus nonylphenolicus TaxID=1008307 RepID=UPI0036F21598